MLNRWAVTFVACDTRIQVDCRNLFRLQVRVADITPGILIWFFASRFLGLGFACERYSEHADKAQADKYPPSKI